MGCILLFLLRRCTTLYHMIIIILKSYFLYYEWRLWTIGDTRWLVMRLFDGVIIKFYHDTLADVSTLMCYLLCRTLWSSHITNMKHNHLVMQSASQVICTPFALCFISVWQKVIQLYTDEFPTYYGVKQGDTLSPTLFSMFINDLAVGVKERNCGIGIGNAGISLLLYADDIVILAPSVADTVKCCIGLVRQVENVSKRRKNTSNAFKTGKICPFKLSVMLWKWSIRNCWDVWIFGYNVTWAHGF